MSLTVVNLLMSNLVLDCERRELWDHENVKENNGAHRMRPGDDRRRSGHQRSPARSQKHPDEHQLRTKAARAARIGEGNYLGKNRKNPGKELQKLQHAQKTLQRLQANRANHLGGVLRTTKSIVLAHLHIGILVIRDSVKCKKL